MPTSRIGVAVSAPDANAIMANIDAASKAGVESVWLTTGGVGLDAVSYTHLTLPTIYSV